MSLKYYLSEHVFYSSRIYSTLDFVSTVIPRCGGIIPQEVDLLDAPKALILTIMPLTLHPYHNATHPNVYYHVYYKQGTLGSLVQHYHETKNQYFEILFLSGTWVQVHQLKMEHIQMTSYERMTCAHYQTSVYQSHYRLTWISYSSILSYTSVFPPQHIGNKPLTLIYLCH